MTVLAVPFHLDEHLPGLDLPLVPDRSITPALPPGRPWERMAILYAEVATAVADAVAAGRVPVVMSGDCTTSLGVVAGLQRAGIDPALVWFDAHGDVQSPETSASGYLGGMPIRQLVGGADRTVALALGMRTVAERDVVLVDARDLDQPELEFLATSAIRRVPISAVPIPDGPLYLHLDIDVIDPAGVPGLLFPATGGPAMDVVADAVETVLASGRVVAVGVACTWAPGSGAAAAVAGMLNGRFAKLSVPRRIMDA